MSAIARAVPALLLFLLGLVAFPTPTASAALNPGSLRTVFSSSGQFVVQGPVPTFRQPGIITTTTNTLVVLEADHLAVICERVKLILLRELNVTDIWTARIHVNALPYAHPDQAANIAVTWFKDGWRYQLDLPEKVAPEKLTRALIHVILLEFANRAGNTRSAELPLWVVEGLTRHLTLAYQNDFVLHPNSFNVTAGVRADPLADTRRLLKAEPPLGFSEMSLLTPDQVTQVNLTRFQASAQLLVNQLTALPNGRAKFLEFIAQLSRVLNWQTAFLRAYQAEFRTLREVEKWWAVVVSNFTGRNASGAWSSYDAPAKLADLLVVVTRGASITNPTAGPVRMPLQQTITNLAYPTHKALLQQKIVQLANAQINAPPNWANLMLRYKTVLEGYIYRRDRAGVSGDQRGRVATPVKLLAEEAVRQLDELDKARATLAQNPAEPPPGTPGRN